MEKNQTKVKYNTQRTCGVWLTYIGVIIIAASLLGGERLIQPIIFGFGYFLGFIAIYGLPFINRKLSYGENSAFQDRMDNLSVFLNVLLCTVLGMALGFNDFRLFWLGIFIVVGFHFFGFYFSQGKTMLLLGVLTIVNGIMGLLFPSIPFLFVAIMDGSIKIFIGLMMLRMKPLTI